MIQQSTGGRDGSGAMHSMEQVVGNEADVQVVLALKFCGTR